MANSTVAFPAFLILDDIALALPDGRVLFESLSEHFDTCLTGLVGRNGVGKSMLARLLADEFLPTQGHITRHGRVRYLAQHIDLSHCGDQTTADLAGLGKIIDALARIERGEPRDDDVDHAEGHWDIALRFQLALQEAGLGHLNAHTPVAQLSGGEARRVALIGAWLDDDAFLILDEPTNHLDRAAREMFYANISTRKSGVLVISHDRVLLDAMARIVELTPQGLRSYGGNYDFYQQTRATERRAQQAALDHARTERKRGERELQRQHDRQQHRSASGNRHGRDANQAKILLGLQKNRSEISSGKMRREHEQQRAALNAAVRTAAQQYDTKNTVALYGNDAVLAEGKTLLHLDRLVLPFGEQTPLDLSVDGPRRIVISGPNGCGKSTLLKVIAGLLPARGGECRLAVSAQYLDQHLAHLDRARNAIELLRDVAPPLSESDARTRLVHIGLDADRAVQSCANLSGGERMKLALACALNATPPAQLLLLDEPDNHLDLVSLQALEASLKNYRGAVITVSHDAHFLRALQPTHHLRCTLHGWRFEPWSPSSSYDGRALG